jgi:hypothetical protein
MRKDSNHPIRSGISPKDFNMVKGFLFFAGYDTDMKTGEIRAVCSQDRPTHRGYAMPAGQFFLDGKEYGIKPINIQEPTLHKDHKNIGRVVTNYFFRKAIGDKPIPAYFGH